MSELSELAQELAKHLSHNRLSTRDAEEVFGVSHSIIQKIITGARDTRKLEMETMVKLSQGLNLPLWRTMQMAGFDLGFPDPQENAGAQSTAILAQRLASLLDRMPEFRPVAEDLLRLRPDDLQSFVTHLEGIKARRERQSRS